MPTNKSIFKNLKGQGGVTLVELVITLVLIGILAAVFSQIVAVPIKVYQQTLLRYERVSEINKIMSSIHTELRSALPNSIRINKVGDNIFIEFVPIRSAGRYRKFISDAGVGDALNFNTEDQRFDILSGALLLNNGDRVVIKNTGVNDGNVFNGLNSSLVLGPFGVNTGVIEFEPIRFPSASPLNNFFIINSPVSYYCNLTTGNIYRFTNYELRAQQPTSAAVLVGLGAVQEILGRGLSVCNFEFIDGVGTRNGIVNVLLGSRLAGLNGENITLFGQVGVLNE